MSILEAIRAQWSASPLLSALVPPSQVHVGPLNPGSAAPAVGLVAETIGGGWRSSSGRYPKIVVTAEAQASAIEILEALREALLDGLASWSSDRYGLIQIEDVAATIARPAQSPSRLWLAEITITLDAKRLL